MKKTIVVLDADKEKCRKLCTALEKRQYRAIPMHSLESMERNVQNGTCRAVIMDINTVLVDNHIIRKLARTYPRAYLFCLSKDRFHPHLEKALSDHVFACITKPVNLDELFYFLRVINTNDAKPGNTSEK